MNDDLRLYGGNAKLCFFLFFSTLTPRLYLLSIECKRKMYGGGAGVAHMGEHKATIWRAPEG